MTKSMRPWVFLALIGILLTGVYFLSRLTNLTALPIFTDEAIYIRWAQIGGRDASWRFISLTDGKQPVFTWALMLFLRLIPGDPLFVGRLTSVATGFLGMIAMGIAGYTIFRSKKVGLIASFLYLISPYALMYDRMALYDSSVALFSVLNLTLSFWLVRSLSLSAALLSGLTLGIGMLNKTSGFLSLYLMPTFAILLDWTKKGRIKRFTLWVCLVMIAVVLSQALYSILRLSPYFYIIGQKDTIFVYPFSEWILHPWEFFRGNFHGIWDWTKTYTTIPILLTVAASFFVSRRFTKEKIILLSWYIIPACGLALFGKVIYPRFVLFMTMPLLLLASFTMARLWERIQRKWIGAIVLGLLVTLMIRLSFAMIRDIKSAPIGRSDRGQYVDDWPSGWGAKDVADYLREEAKTGPVAVYTEGTFGLLPYALEIYLDGVPGVEIHGVWPPPIEIPEDILASSVVKPTYYVTNLSQTPPDWNITKISEYRKGLNEASYMRLYQVHPSEVR